MNASIHFFSSISCCVFLFYLRYFGKISEQKEEKKTKRSEANMNEEAAAADTFEAG